MAAKPPAFEIAQHGPVNVIHFTRHVSDRLVVERLKADIQKLLDVAAGPPRFVIDFSQVREMSSAILGVVMGINLKICRSQGRLRLCSIGPELMEVFHIMKLDRILNIDPTLDESLQRINE